MLEQTWLNLEIIIVDDASDDTTQEVIAGFEKEYPIKNIQNHLSKGAAKSRNIAIDNASGEFIAGLDDDDYWRPKRLELLMEEFKEGFSAVTSNDRMIFGNKEIVWKKKPVITLDDLLYYNQVGNQVLTKKSYLKDVGGYDENLPSAQDYDLWIRLAHDFGPIKSVPHTLQVVSMSDDRISITTSNSQIKGYLDCFYKHEKKMNATQKKYQHYRIELAKGENKGWLDLFRSVPTQLLVKEITRKLFL